MSGESGNKINESQVVNLWRQQIVRQRVLADVDGQRLEVIYPGRLNDSRGADFRDAVISSSRGKVHGSIEVHTLASNWQTHGHHLDPVYNQVVLHVALKQGKSGKTVLQNGDDVPTVILERSAPEMTSGAAAGTGLPCGDAVRKLGAQAVMDSLERAGDRRFIDKAARFQSEWIRIEIGQSFYQGFLEALGYAKNKEPFLELSRRAPLKLANRLLQSTALKEENLDYLEAFLLGQAGFLPSQRGGRQPGRSDEYVKKLERNWGAFPGAGIMDFHQWELFKVRPGNHPIRRIVALSRLLYRYRKTGLLPSLLNLMRAMPSHFNPNSMERNLVVVVEGYWERRFDFGLCDTFCSPVLLGRERAAEIMVNVILPFALAWSRIAPEPDLGNKVIGFFERYPRLEINSIERHMLQQLNCSASLIKTARRQQGLLHIYKSLCTQGKCRECELGF
jgi:hypothetical protein